MSQQKYFWNILNPQGAFLMRVVSVSEIGALRQARKQWDGELVAVQLDRV